MSQPTAPYAGPVNLWEALTSYLPSLHNPDRADKVLEGLAQTSQFNGQEIRLEAIVDPDADPQGVGWRLTVFGCFEEQGSPDEMGHYHAENVPSFVIFIPARGFPRVEQHVDGKFVA